MTLEQFNSNYQYKSDKDKFGYKEVWEVPTPNVDGIYESDCESYVLGLQEYTSELDDAELYFCRISGEGHCIAIRDGRVLDCNCQAWMGIEEYTTKYKMTSLSKYWLIGIWYRKISTKLFGRVL